MKIKKSKSLASIPMLVSELKLCSSSRNLERGKELHAAAVRSGDHSNIYVASTLVDMYAKCSSMVEARRVFNGMISQDVVSWTSLILGYAQNGEGGLALELFQRMMKMFHTSDAQAFIAALKACSSLVSREEEGKQEIEKRSIKFRCLEKVMAVHSHAEKCGCDLHFKVASSLVDLYARCGSMSDARQVFEGMKFRNVVSWTALISGYAQNGQGQTSLELFQQMIRSEGCSSFQQVVETQNEISENRPGCSCAPNSQTFVAALKACISLAENEEISVDERSVKLKSVEKGMAVHAAAARSCLSSDIFVGNSLIDMYSKCGSMADAQSVFDRMKLHTVVSWTALMLGYAHSGHPREALEVFERLLQESQDCSPNSQTFAVACSSMADLGIGKRLHAAVCRRGFESEVIVSNCLVDLYSKCGSVAAASEMFDSAGCRDIVTWNTLIAGYSRQGRSFERVWELFNRMQDEGFTPNSVTLVSVLTACSHAGLVEKGKECFRLMRSKFGIGAEIDHYHCMIDLLGRANQLDVAMERCLIRMRLLGLLCWERARSGSTLS